MKGGYSFVSLSFRSIDKSGHIGLKVAIEQDSNRPDRSHVRSSVTLGFVVEPAEIDRLVVELRSMIAACKGKVVLYGDEAQ